MPSFAPIFYVVQAPDGKTVSGATVTVKVHADSSSAPLYQDENGSVPVPGTTGVYVTDSAGRAVYGGNQVWVLSGRYDLTVSGPSLATFTVVRDFFSTYHMRRVLHAYTLDDQTTPNTIASVLASWTATYSTGETGTLYGVYHRINGTRGATPSVFLVQSDHGNHGTFATVTGLSAITPNTGAATLVQPTGGPMILAEGDTVRLVASTPGTSTGAQIEMIEEKSVV